MVVILVSLPIFQVHVTLPYSVFRTQVRFCGMSGGSERDIHMELVQNITLNDIQAAKL